MLVARRFVVHGRVQGVGFRYFAHSVALTEGIQGWVANREDRSVEIFAEGDLESVERFERHIRRGPPGARIDDVFVDDDVPTERKTGFRIDP